MKPDETTVEEFQEPQVGFAKFENPGDEVIGTYVGKVNIPKKGVFPEQIGYQLLIDGVEVIAAFNLTKEYTHKCMKGAKIGQRVKFVFTDWFETDDYKKALAKLPVEEQKPENVDISRAKTIKTYLGKMDEAYLNGFEEVKEGDTDVNGKPINF